MYVYRHTLHLKSVINHCMYNTYIFIYPQKPTDFCLWWAFFVSSNFFFFVNLLFFPNSHPILIPKKQQQGNFPQWTDAFCLLPSLCWITCLETAQFQKKLKNRSWKKAVTDRQMTGHDFIWSSVQTGHAIPDQRCKYISRFSTKYETVLYIAPSLTCFGISNKVDWVSRVEILRMITMNSSTGYSCNSFSHSAYTYKPNKSVQLVYT